ncbi:hypothetical protein DFH06DRAFT_1151810 [Mycena polygramma]|nr:hypothetical protein DFH06DRAFT_1151810 [Mycena polygramma]
MSDQEQDIVAPWKSKRFRDYELSWEQAAESLNSDSPLIEVKSNKTGGRWTVYDKSTGKLAIFHHAGIWAYASPPGSGNFVPPGEVAPPGTYEGRITPYLGRRAETSYAINTENDESFHDAAQIVEDHVVAHKDFNKYNKPRRSWQNGSNRRRFVFASRLVIRKTPYNTKDGKPRAPQFPVHPWVEKTLKELNYTNWVPNPDIPRLHDYVEGKLDVVHPEDSRYFSRGDVVWFSFALTFEIDGDSYYPEFKPLDFIRVVHGDASPETRAEYTMEAEVGGAYQSLTSGNITLLDDGEGRRRKGEKRQHESDEDETMSEISEYSAAQAALEPSKRRRVEDPGPATKPASKPERKANGKAKWETRIWSKYRKTATRLPVHAFASLPALCAACGPVRSRLRKFDERVFGTVSRAAAGRSLVLDPRWTSEVTQTTTSAVEDAAHQIRGDTFYAEVYDPQTHDKKKPSAARSILACILESMWTGITFAEKAKRAEYRRNRWADGLKYLLKVGASE